MELAGIVTFVMLACIIGWLALILLGTWAQMSREEERAAVTDAAAREERRRRRRRG